MVAVFALAACGGGGGGSPAPSAPTTAGPTTPGPTATPSSVPILSNEVTPHFTIVFGSSGQSAGRKPQRVSPATNSITILFSNAPNGVTPTSVTTSIVPAACPCTVSGPPAPAGASATMVLTTYASSDGSGAALDTGTVTFTPTIGIVNNESVTLQGIPATVAISGVPTSFAANASNSSALTVSVADAANQTIASGAYANPVTISATDANGTQGVQLTGTNAGSCSAPTTCVSLTSATDTATLHYGGIAENPITISSGGTNLTTAGTATFTPVLNAITGDASNPTTQLGGTGIDLYTTNSASSVGYSGTVSYYENGFTNSPYNKTLALNGSCPTIASLQTGANVSGETPFTAQTVASPSGGQCTLTVTDGLTDQPNALPTFKVTYTASTIGVSGKTRR